MSQVRFCADLHFGHTWMAKHRGFQDDFYHDDHIIDMWNRNIHKKDLTYILGDITLSNPTHFYRLDALNGRKIVILGNHDRYQDVPELLRYVEAVGAMIQYKGVFLTHCPIHPNELNWRVPYNIHGHIHENVLDDNRYICVSMENIGYVPKTIEELIPGWSDKQQRNEFLAMHRLKRNL